MIPSPAIQGFDPDSAAVVRMHRFLASECHSTQLLRPICNDLEGRLTVGPETKAALDPWGSIGAIHHESERADLSRSPCS